MFITVFGTLSAWDEFNRYSIEDELRKPGVKLVAVDFYATWCEPCKAAIPKWKKLQEKYGDKGLKLIVVSVQSEGSCSQPPQWNPDKIVCDYEGDIANAWHANNLPQAFLWSWQGNLLVAHGGVDNVAEAIEKYFKNIPRVLVEEGKDKDIYKMVRSELIKNSKIEVVASDEERKALAELRKKSNNLNYDAKLRCKLGEEVSANSRLMISTQKRGQKETLVLELFSVEKGCLTASGTATMRGNTETEVAEAVYNLLKNLLGDFKMPGEDRKSAKAQKQAGQTSNFQDSVACEYARGQEKDFAWKAYLKKYPKGECVAEAKEELDRLTCKKAEKKNSVETWDAYLKEFPNGKCKAKAKEEFDKAACKKAEQQNSAKGWKEYLKKFPEGKCTAKAKVEFDKAACKSAEKKDSVDAWKEYIDRFPKGKCAAKAKEEFDKASCKIAEKSNNINDWKDYLSEFPNGKCKAEAQTAIQKLQAKQQEKNKADKTYHPYKRAGISLIAVGAAVTVAGVAGFHVASDKEYNKYKKFTSSDLAVYYVDRVTLKRYVEKADRYRKTSNTFRALEITSGVVGGAVFVTGIVLTAIKKDKPQKVVLSDISLTPSNEGFYASIGFDF